MSKYCFLTLSLLCCAAIPLHASEDAENEVIQEAEAACSTLFTPPQWNNEELIFYNQPSWSILVGITIFACAFFLFAIIVFKRYRKTFLTLDRKGIILDNGKRLLWKEIEWVEEKDIKRTSFSSDLAKAYDFQERKNMVAEEMYFTKSIMDAAGRPVINAYQDYFLEITIRDPEAPEETPVRTVKLKKGLGGMSSYQAMKDLMDLIRAYQEAYQRVEEGEEWDVEYAKSKFKDSFSDLEMQTLKLKNVTTGILALFVGIIGFIEVMLCWGLYCQYNKSWEKICTMGNVSMIDHRDDMRYPWSDVLAWEQSRTIDYASQSLTNEVNPTKEYGLFVSARSNNIRYKLLLFPGEIIPPSIWKKEVIDAIQKGTFYQH